MSIHREIVLSLLTHVILSFPTNAMSNLHENLDHVPGLNILLLIFWSLLLYPFFEQKYLGHHLMILKLIKVFESLLALSSIFFKEGFTPVEHRIFSRHLWVTLGWTLRVFFCKAGTTVNLDVSLDLLFLHSIVKYLYLKQIISIVRCQSKRPSSFSQKIS